MPIGICCHHVNCKHNLSVCLPGPIYLYTTMCFKHLDHDSFMQIVVLIPSKLRLEARFKLGPNDVRFTALISSRFVLTYYGMA